VHYSITRLLNGHRISLSTNLLLLSVLCLGCGGPAPLTVDMPLHLEEHLDAATIVLSQRKAPIHSQDRQRAARAGALPLG
jgi:hypothetical protein